MLLPPPSNKCGCSTKAEEPAAVFALNARIVHIPVAEDGAVERTGGGEALLVSAGSPRAYGRGLGHLVFSDRRQQVGPEGT